MCEEIWVIAATVYVWLDLQIKAQVGNQLMNI